MKIKLVDQNRIEHEITWNNILNKYDKTILYFYPKDNTPGCSLEANDFSKNKKLFNKNGIGVIGVSKDSCKSHINFINKQELDVDLISDENLELHKKFSVIGEKKMYGKVYEGVIRSTFLLDKSGLILKERRDIKAKGHVEEIIKELRVQS